MALWTDLGLPLAQRSGYGYSVDSGVLRSPVDAAQPQQLRKWRTNKKTFTAAYLLTQAELQTAEGFLEAVGASWFVMPLLSGRDEFEPIIDHCVRLVQDYRVESAGEDVYKLTLVLEQLVETSVYGTTVLFPVEDLEATYQDRPDTPQGRLMVLGWVDAPAIRDPLFPSIELVQTYFPHPYADTESVYQSVPETPTGQLGQTYYPHPYSHDDATYQSAPDTPYGSLVVEYIPLFYTPFPDAVLQSAPMTPTGSLT